MLNKVILIGRLTSDIELRHSNDRMPYCYFTLAVGRQGAKDKTDFIPCVAFRSTAELMQRYLAKGSLISLEGRLEVYRSENAGEYQTRTNVVVNNVNFLDSKRSNDFNNKVSFANDSKQMNHIDNDKFSSSTSKSNNISNDINDEEFDFDNFEIEI